MTLVNILKSNMAAKFMICSYFVGNGYAKHINSRIVQINDKGMKIGI